MKKVSIKQLVVSISAVFTFAFATGQNTSLLIAEGKFKPTDESLKQYAYPEWFRDAKFGIWSHWGPQAVPRKGDWYARKMYESDAFNRRAKTYTGKPDPAYTHHVANYGHPSVFGYKDIIPLWKAERWNPEELMKLYKKVGARYFVSMGTHHDNFFLWNSKIHRWNSVNMGPKKDVVGIWQQAAKKEGLYFGISEHLAASYTWYQTNKGADKTGDKAGVPYDGNDPRFQDLYHGKADSSDNEWMTKKPVWQHQWFERIKEVVDMYQPDLLYSDSRIPFENEVGRSLIAHYYNQDMTKNRGNLQAVYNCKEPSFGRFVRDIERGANDTISEFPWQTDTSIGDWYYRTGQKYATSDEVVQMLVDIVSKNGNLLLNVVQTPEGDLEPDVLQILDGIGNWIQDNGEAIYSSRPWKIYGEGPSTVKQEKGRFGGVKDIRAYQSSDIRYTTKNDVLYAFCMETIAGDVQLNALGKQSKYSNKQVASVSMLGSNEKIQWKQDDNMLVINKPANLPKYKVAVFSIKFKN